MRYNIAGFHISTLASMYSQVHGKGKVKNNFPGFPLLSPGELFFIIQWIVQFHDETTQIYEKLDNHYRIVILQFLEEKKIPIRHDQDIYKSGIQLMLSFTLVVLIRIIVLTHILEKIGIF
jgi:hypothetical protein